MNKKAISLGLAIMISGSMFFSSVEAKTTQKPKSHSVSKKSTVKSKSKKVKTSTKKAYNPYEWAPGVKKRFETDMVRNGYADSLNGIRYVKNGVYNNQGYCKVYAKLGGVECYIVNVNVKTGNFHG